MPKFGRTGGGRSPGRWLHLWYEVQADRGRQGKGTVRCSLEVTEFEDADLRDITIDALEARFGLRHTRGSDRSTRLGWDEPGRRVIEQWDHRAAPDEAQILRTVRAHLDWLHAEFSAVPSFLRSKQSSARPSATAGGHATTAQGERPASLPADLGGPASALGKRALDCILKAERLARANPPDRAAFDALAPGLLDHHQADRAAGLIVAAGCLEAIYSVWTRTKQKPADTLRPIWDVLQNVADRFQSSLPEYRTNDGGKPLEPADVLVRWGGGRRLLRLRGGRARPVGQVARRDDQPARGVRRRRLCRRVHRPPQVDGQRDGPRRWSRLRAGVRGAAAAESSADRSAWRSRGFR